MELCRDLPAGMLYQLIENWEKLTADISEVCLNLNIYICMLAGNFNFSEFSFFLVESMFWSNWIGSHY